MKKSDYLLLVVFGVMQKVAVPVLTGPSHIDLRVEEIRPSERTMVVYNSDFVPLLLMIADDDIWGKAKREKQRFC